MYYIIEIFFNNNSYFIFLKVNINSCRIMFNCVIDQLKHKMLLNRMCLSAYGFFNDITYYRSINNSNFSDRQFKDYCVIFWHYGKHILIYTYQHELSQNTLNILKHSLPYRQMFKLHSTQKCFQNAQELPLILNLTYLTWKIITKFVLKLHTIHYIVPIILVHRYTFLDLVMHFIKYLYFVGTKSSYRRIIPILSDTTLKMDLKF